MTCVLCGWKGPGRRVLEARGAALLRCAGCGLVRVDPIPSEEALRRLYGPSYYRDPARGYLDYAADEAVFRGEFRRRLRLLSRLRPGARLLDVGCATGGLLLEAAALGFRPEGIEPSPEVAAAAARRSGFPVRAGPVETADLPSEAFGVAAVFEVLEHLRDPLAGLRAVVAALAPGGLAAVSVPDFGSPWARLSGARWPLLTPWEHLTYFTRDTLAATLRASGLMRVRFVPARTVFSVATLLAHLAGRGRGGPGRGIRAGIGIPFGTLLAFAEKPTGISVRSGGRAP